MDKQARITQHIEIMKLYQRAVIDSALRQELAEKDGHLGKNEQDIIEHYDKHAKQLAILIAYEQSQI